MKKTEAQQVFGILVARGVVHESRHEAFQAFYGNPEKRRLPFSEIGSNVLPQGWFLKGTGVCCPPEFRAQHSALLRELNADLDMTMNPRFPRMPAPAEFAVA